MAKYLLKTHYFTRADGTQKSYQHVMRHDELKARLGLPEKLPKDFSLPPTEVDGVMVFVTKSPVSRKKRSNPLYRWQYHTSKHRVNAICPDCGRVVSAARLAQHTKTHS